MTAGLDSERPVERARDTRADNTIETRIPGDGSAPPIDLPSVYLHPGQLWASAEGGLATTILGSCVSVCLFDHAVRVGGANHFLLPAHSPGMGSSLRHGSPAIQALLERMLRLGAARERMVAKVFGGANVLTAFSARAHHLGALNVDTAHEVLRAEGVRIVAEDVGGVRGRKLVFSTADGTAWVRPL